MSHRLVSCIGALLLILANATAARADAAPPDACWTEGDRCNNAAGSRPGICSQAQCTRVVPNDCLAGAAGESGQGGAGEAGGGREARAAGCSGYHKENYDCLRCVATSGNGGQGGANGGAGGSGDDSGCSCRMAGNHEQSIAALMMLGGLTAFGASRRHARRGGR